MRRESKSLWLRRIGPLGVAGLLVWPLAGSAEEAAAQKEVGHLDLYSAEHKTRENEAKAVNEARWNALMLRKTAEEKLTIEKALKLAEAGKPEEAMELFAAQCKSEAEMEQFKRMVVERTAGRKTPSKNSPSPFDTAGDVNAGQVSKAFAARQETALRLGKQQDAVRNMVEQGQFKAAEDALKKLIRDLLPNQKKDAEKVLTLVDQCDFNGAQTAVKELFNGQRTWNTEKLSEILKDYQELYRAWSASLMKDAQGKAKAGDFTEAIALAQRAQKLDINRTYIKNFIEGCQNQLEGEAFRKATSLDTFAPDYRKNQKEIDHTLREAKIFFRNQQYETATVRLERVLLIDPFNLEALDLLSECYTRLFHLGRQRTITSAGRAEALNIWEWAEPLERVQIDPATAKEATVHNSEKTDIYNKLERVIFPSISLKDYTLASIIAYLNDKSRAYDPDHEGVTIIDNLAPKDKQRKLTVEFGKISLLDIIRYISLETGFSYTFTNNKVTFGNVDSMSTQTFPVRGEIIAEIIDAQLVKQSDSGMKASEGEGGGDAGDDKGGGASLGATGGADGGAEGGASLTMGANEEGAEAASSQSAAQAVAAAKSSSDSAALKAYFAERWITFGPGANIIYSPRGERLVVRNTPENLHRMATLLNQLDALEQPMILVEVKLIELADTNLSELGFEWAFSASDKDGKWSMGTSDPVRHGDTEGNQYRLINNLKILPNFGEKIFGSDVNVDLSLSINAVSQNNRAELLSSPRILTVSGSKTPAKIQMTEKTYFVTEWEQPDVESNGFSISMDISAPDWDEERDLGVTFSVKPTVDSDNYTITLEDIHPKFLEHISDEDYDVAYETGTIIDGVQNPVKKFNYHMRMPEFANREITSTITLYDGETVLLGGMADNESVARSDKWPFLGDIPFFGKFFTDQKTDVSNHSMLIFITARLVNANGVPLRSVRDRGVLEFNR